MDVKKEVDDMNNRILLKAHQMDYSVVLRLISKSERREFWFDRKTIIAIGTDKRLIVRDGDSFAEIWVREQYTEVRFTWLKNLGSEYRARKETVRIPNEFWWWMTCHETGDLAMLALADVDPAPAIRFQSRKNLKRVVQNPLLRHKLSVFLSRNFLWHDSSEIILTDDCEPNSFFFQELLTNGSYGLCGGVILHTSEKRCHYSIHT